MVTKSKFSNHSNMLLEVAYALLAIVSVLLCCDFVHKWKYRSIIRHFPGPPSYPIIGHALEFRTNSVDKHKDLFRIIVKYGPNANIKIGPLYQYLAIADPELTEFFINSMKFLKKSADYNLLRPWIANGLLTSTGNYWQKRRKIITPTFHFKILNDFIPILNAGSAILVQRLATEVGKDVCNIYPYITTYTLDNICETAMGTSVNAQINTEHKFVVAVNKLCKIIFDRGFSAWKNIDALFQFSNSYKEHQGYLKTIHGFTNSVIAKKRQELLVSKEDDQTHNENDIGAKKRVAFLDLLLQSTIDGKPLSDADISEEVNTFMFEGHDTTASAIAFALYELARNPHTQEAAIKELWEIFGDDKRREPTISELNNMKYIELVIKETLRLYPSVPIFGRQLTEDVVRNGVTYPKGLAIIFFPAYMHRRPDLFNDPNKFEPNRFAPENSEVKNPFAYIPFSAGPRNCIGQKFAMYELKSAISKVLRHYVLSPADPKYDVLLASEVILKSANGMCLRLAERTYEK